MSGEADFGGFAPPPFDAAQSLLQIQRALRDLKLTGRGNGFELRGRRVAEFEVSGSTIKAKVARRAALTPEWDRVEIRSAADQRKCIDELKKRLERWEREE